MKSIAEIFDNSKELLDSISNFIDKYHIGMSLPPSRSPSFFRLLYSSPVHFSPHNSDIFSITASELNSSLVFLMQ